MGDPANDQGDVRTTDGLPLPVHGPRTRGPTVVPDLAALVEVNDLARLYDFGASHPLRPERVLLAYERIRALGLTALDHVNELSARVAADDEIMAAHDPEFVSMVKAIDEGAAPARAGLEFGLGTPDDPVFPNMHAASAAVCGASLTAVEAVLDGTAMHAFNPAGGLHHARRREASGFCIYDDPAVAIAKILERRPEWRVMYIDIDVHHGDGVQWIFYGEPRVLTVSFHQSGRYLYPGTGFEDETGEADAVGTAANVPLLPLTGDDDYLWALERVVPTLAAAFKPDILVTQLGADTHWGDPLANLALTMRAYPRIAELLHETAHGHASGRWMAMGGGGYQFDTVVPKVWTMHFAEMCGAPELIPEGWLEDRDQAEVSRPWRSEIERSCSQVLEACVPRLETLTV